MIRCEEHPDYTVEEAPTYDCGVCLMLWDYKKALQDRSELEVLKALLVKILKDKKSSLNNSMMWWL